MKSAYIDIGELGYSFFLSAHIKWLEEQGRPADLVMTYPGRRCLYNDWSKRVENVPDEFYKKFDTGRQQEFKIGRGIPEKLDGYFRDYFNEKLPEGYHVAKDMNFDVVGRIPDIYRNERILYRYPYKEIIRGTREILVFTRYRNYNLFNRRDIPKRFWIKMIEGLCDAFPNHIIRAMGTKKGAHNITGGIEVTKGLCEIKKDNYINWVGMTSDFQKVIDRCHVADAVIGGDTGPLKFILLQEVPTFMIGWQWDWIKEQNYCGTPFQFYKITLEEHREFNDKMAIIKAIQFLRMYT